MAPRGIRFENRRSAGKILARELHASIEDSAAVVLALPRGGVPVGYEIARALGLMLDVFLVRKLGVPLQPELAMGAIASGGTQVLNPQILQEHGILPEVLAAVTAAERVELERGEYLYRGERAPIDPSARTVILVDDGIATGATMRAAVQALRKSGARRIVAAAPVGSRDALGLLQREADAVILSQIPGHFGSVGEWYEDFEQMTDREVHDLLATANQPSS